MATHSDTFSDHQRAILGLLAESPVPRFARWMVRRVEPRRSTASHAGVLRGLHARGLVEKHFEPSWSGDRWSITDAGREALDRG